MMIKVTVSTVLTFSKCHIVEIIQYVVFLDGVFHLVKCISGFSMSFYSLVVHFSLVLNDIPLYGCTISLFKSLFISVPIEGHFGCFQ